MGLRRGGSKGGAYKFQGIAHGTLSALQDETEASCLRWTGAYVFGEDPKPPSSTQPWNAAPLTVSRNTHPPGRSSFVPEITPTLSHGDKD